VGDEAVIGRNSEAEWFPCYWLAKRSFISSNHGFTLQPARKFLLIRGDLKPGMTVLVRANSNLTDRPQLIKLK
jgi:hypothetical protein